MGIFGSGVSEVNEPWGTYTLIDVRSKSEWDEGHINGAILIPHTQIEQKIADYVSDKNYPIKLYCRSGHRASIAEDALKKMGYQNVVNLGGYNSAKKLIKDAPAE